MASTKTACRPKCSHCCTCNVTLTSLEARFITFFLPPAQKKAVYTKITQTFPEKRFIPGMTTNQFARLCMEGADLPNEENDPSWGKCPLLENDLCTVYDVRPFGCRALMSETDCMHTDCAQMPPWILTLNNLFLQAIEHLDQKEYSGNLSDMLQIALSGNDVTHQDMQHHDPKNEALFVKNECIKCLMIPPEHRERMDPIVKNLSELINSAPDTGHDTNRKYNTV
ncbi:MAG TPA: YkgJ family cysteine cluster protein [Desulfotignum sp.]|nr:YkgJ family cysteine cluster protein [Desulfotignum sp.]